MKNSYDIAVQKILSAEKNNPFYLDLSNLGLKSFPLEILRLKKLAEIDLSNNCLSVLPSEISVLQNLKVLNLRHNCFNYINGIGFDFPCYSQIEYIDLSYNNLSDLPDDIFYLEHLKDINLEGNPVIADIPNVILDMGYSAVDNYAKEMGLARATDSIFEAKLIFVGQGDVGKTSLMKKLVNRHFVVVEGKEKTTHGINIKKWNSGVTIQNSEILDTYIRDQYGSYEEYYEYCQDNEIHINPELPKTQRKDIELNIWDFGGQEIYYSTHQFFLTKRSIYVLVWDSRKEESSQGFKYWLNAIKLLGEDSPLIIVMNKADKRIRHIDEKNLIDSYPNIKSFHQVSCITGKGLQKLKESIIDSFKKSPHFGDRLPKAWVDIKNELSAINENYIHYKIYIEICKNFGITQRRANYLSGYYHDLGYILHYKEDPILKDIVILNPEWGTKAFYGLIDDRVIQENDGRFSFHKLSRVWDTNIYPKEKHHELIRLMEKFEICFNLIGTSEYIIPELLNHKTAKGIDQIINEVELRFEYGFRFMPAGIITRFICRIHDMIQKNSFWKTGTIVNFKDAKALVMSDETNEKIKIFVKGDERVELLGIIRKEIDVILKKLNLKRDSDFQEMIPCICNECKGKKEPHFFKYKTINLYRKKNKELITCDLSIKEVEIIALTKGYENVRISDKILRQIIRACSKLQGQYKVIDSGEDSRNGYIANMIMGDDIVAKDQTRWGASQTKKSQGELDIKFEDKNGLTIGVFEGMNLDGLKTSKIIEHLEKLFNYDANGLKQKYLITYSDAPSFEGLWEKYINCILENDLKYPLNGKFEDISEERSYGYGLKIGKTQHIHKERNYTIYHLFLNMNFE